MKLLLIDAAAVKKLIDLPTAIEAVEAAFAAFGRGEARMPSKLYLDVPEGDFRAMPAYLPGAAGVKWINVHPNNPSRNDLPTVMGLILLNDPLTGQPLALIDGTLITSYRTGAAAAVATRRLARPEAKTLALVGCGGQALSHLRALTSVMTPETIFLVDARRENAQRLADKFPQFAIEVCGLAELGHACEADVISTLTPSRGPIVLREWIRPGTHINAIGADAPGKQELEIALLFAARIYVDDWAQASHSGEINVAYSQGRLKTVAGTLPDLIVGKAEGRTSPEQITIFDSTGLAIQDLALARIVYEQARLRHEGLEIEFKMG